MCTMLFVFDVGVVCSTLQIHVCAGVFTWCLCMCVGVYNDVGVYDGCVVLCIDNMLLCVLNLWCDLVLVVLVVDLFNCVLIYDVGVCVGVCVCVDVCVVCCCVGDVVVGGICVCVIVVVDGVLTCDVLCCVLLLLVAICVCV